MSKWGALALLGAIAATFVLGAYLLSPGAGASDKSTVRVRLPAARSADPAPAFSNGARPITVQ